MTDSSIDNLVCLLTKGKYHQLSYLIKPCFGDFFLFYFKCLVADCFYEIMPLTRQLNNCFDENII